MIPSCERCGTIMIVVRETEAPTGDTLRVYVCPYCGDTDED